MITLDEFKNFYRYISLEELHDDTQKWKKQIKFLQYELTFLKSLLDANIYNSKIRDLFETLQLYKKDINDLIEDGFKIRDSLLSHEGHLKIYLECDDISFDYFFIEIHAKMNYDITVFKEDSNNLKMELFEYIEKAIIK